MGEAFFVTLPNSNLTINVATILVISWDQVPKEWARAGYIATVQIVSRNCIYLDGEDAFILQNAIHEYNLRMGHDTRSTQREPNSTRQSGSTRDGWNQAMRIKQGA